MIFSVIFSHCETYESAQDLEHNNRCTTDEIRDVVTRGKEVKLKEEKWKDEAQKSPTQIMRARKKDEFEDIKRENTAFCALQDKDAQIHALRRCYDGVMYEAKKPEQRQSRAKANFMKLSQQT